MQEIFTIGFGQKSLKKFIQLLKKAGVTRVIDVRLNNTSQLSGFAKRDDLQFILELVGIDYVHEISLAPDKLLLDDYKSNYKLKDCKWAGLVMKGYYSPSFSKVYACIGLATQFLGTEYPQLIGLHTTPDMPYPPSYPDNGY